jgi:pyruvate,water dikinase
VHRASSKSSDKAVIHFSDLPPDATAIAGGKGASLGRMSAAGLPVPPGFVIASNAFQAFLQSCDGVDTIGTLIETLDIEDAAAVERVAARIQALITSTPLPDALVHSIRTAHGDLTNSALVAVRSSAVSEDGTGASFAGQQETYLNVRGLEDVLRRVQECWASFFSPRALFYRAQKSVLADTRMAVVVQEMIQPDKSGVMFTVDPVRNRRECLVIEAAPGLGEALVSGVITPDHYVVLRTDGSAIEEFLPDPDRDRVLDDDELVRLRDVGMKLEEFFGSPQDVEWCIRGGELLLLQSRPITTLAAHG